MNVPATIPPKNKGGRPKGSRNRSSMLLKSIQIEMEKMYGVKDWDPAIFLSGVACNPLQPIDIRIVAAGKVLPFVHAAAKPMVIEEKSKRPVNMEQLMTRIAKDLLIENKVVTKEQLSPTDDEDDDDEEPQQE